MLDIQCHTVKMKNSSNPEDDDEYMIINDEDVRAVVPDPSQIRNTSVTHEGLTAWQKRF